MSAEEVWKKIPRYPKYEASTLGRIKNIETHNILVPSLSGEYQTVGVNKDTKTIHYLVALAFVPNPDKKKTVDHKNRNRTDNRPENLEWATRKEQAANRKPVALERKQEISARPVWRLDKDTNERIERYISLREATQWVFDNNLTKVKEFNGGQNLKTAICAVCRGKQGYAYNYKWTYCEDNVINHEGEIWKNIPPEFIHGTKGYKVSSYGQIENRTGRRSECGINQSGYKNVKISENQYLVHRLVAQAFLPNPENKPFVNHINGKKDDPRLENLNWMTQKENSEHAVEAGLHKLGKGVIQYDMNNNKIAEFKSQSEASRKTGILRSSIGMCVSGNHKSAGGFVFVDNSYGTSFGRRNNTGKKVIQYDLNMNKLNEFDSAMEAGRVLNICSGTIGSCCNHGKCSTAGGFKFEFAD